LRGDIDVAEITDLLRDRLVRTGWPKTMRVIVRRTKLAPGEQPTLFHLDGCKYSCFVTNTGPGLSIQLLDARHRAHARVEDRVRTGKDTGLGHLPSKSWTVNLAWCHAVSIAVDLLAWLKLLGCPDLPALNNAEPATLRYRLLHVPARLVRHARIRWLRVPRTWPWAAGLTHTFDRIRALPTPRPVEQRQPCPDDQEDQGDHARRRDSRPTAISRHHRTSIINDEQCRDRTPITPVKFRGRRGVPASE